MFEAERLVERECRDHSDQGKEQIRTMKHVSRGHLKSGAYAAIRTEDNVIRCAAKENTRTAATPVRAPREKWNASGLLLFDTR